MSAYYRPNLEGQDSLSDENIVSDDSLERVRDNMIAGAKLAELAGFGRQTSSSPNFAADVCHKGEIDRKQLCLTCSKCTELMRTGSKTGCILRDQEL